MVDTGAIQIAPVTTEAQADADIAADAPPAVTLPESGTDESTES